jgi:hypothetical protein
VIHSDAEVRPELIALDTDQRNRVVELVAARDRHCDSCGGTDFAVGHALYLGFLFLDEEEDAYLVALTCRNATCAMPRIGIRLARKEFLDFDGKAAATG